MAACDNAPEATTSMIVWRRFSARLAAAAPTAAMAAVLPRPALRRAAVPFGVAEGLALLCESFTGNCKGFPRALGDHIAFALGDHRHDTDDRLVGVG